MRYLRNMILIVCFLPISLLANEATKKPLTPEDIVNIRQVNDPQISPDGKWVAFVVTEPADSNKPEMPRYSNIWLVPSDGSAEPRKYAFSPKQETMPRWSPNGAYLAFLSNRGEDDKTQIHVMHVSGGEAEAVTKMKEGVGMFKWLSDSRTIAFTSMDTLTVEEEKNQEVKNDAKILDENYKFMRLYEVDMMARDVTLLTREDENVNDFDYAPDNKKIAISVSPSPKTDDVYYASQTHLIILNRDGTQRTTINSTVKGFEIDRSWEGCLNWSPDGAWIAFLFPISDAMLPALTSADGKEVIPLLTDYRGSVWKMDWLGKDHSLFVSAQEGCQGIIGVLNKDEHQVTRLKEVGIENYGQLTPWSVSSDGKWIAYLDAGVQSPRDVWVMKSDGSDHKQLSQMNPQVDSFAFGYMDVIQWESMDGMQIEGILVKPPDYDVSHTYPLVVHVHGGPTWSWWNGWVANWHNWSQLLSANGYVVLLPNPRGSTGKGWKFATANLSDWGGGDFEDIMSGVNFLIEQGIVDSTRMGFGGWSYGGYMTSWAMTQTDRFKAAIMGAGLSNLVSMYGTTDIPGCIKENFEGFPFDREQVYQQRSAISFVKNVKTPTLILHGKNDRVVPISQSYEFYQSLRDLGVETQFVVYPREPHSINERAHQVDLMHRVVDWFDSYLKSD